MKQQGTPIFEKLIEPWSCNNHDLRERARDLRRNPTKAEALLWSMLRQKRMLGCKFRRQHPIPPFIVDFFCHRAKLAVEVDGEKHHCSAQRTYDEHRDQLLDERGVRVLRFTNEDVLHHLEPVTERIKEELRARVRSKEEC